MSQNLGQIIPNIQIGTVTQGTVPAVVNVGTGLNPIFNFTLPQATGGHGYDWNVWCISYQNNYYLSGGVYKDGVTLKSHTIKVYRWGWSPIQGQESETLIATVTTDPSDGSFIANIGSVLPRVNYAYYLEVLNEQNLLSRYTFQGATEQGQPGQGVPAGGTTGQILAKASNTDYDTEWVNGATGSVDWTDIQNKPTTFPPSSHTHSEYYTKTETDAAISNSVFAEANLRADADTTLSNRIDALGNPDWTDIQNKPTTFPPESHNHDDRYYTESETDTLLNAKANSSHTHTKSDITDFPSTITLVATLQGGTTQTFTLYGSTS